MTTIVSQVLAQKGRTIVALTGDETVHQASQILSQKRIGAAVILDANGTLRGIFSERDLVRIIAQQGSAALAIKVSEVMTSTVTVCSESDAIVSLMKQMTEGRFRHIPVVTDNRVVGLISIGDVVKSRMVEMENEVEAMRHYISQ